MYCGECGKPVKEGARFCVYCGELINQKNIESASDIDERNERYTIVDRKRKIDIRLLILPILILIVIIFICVVGYNKSQVKGKYYEIFEGKYTGYYIDFKSNGIVEDRDGHKFLYRQNRDIVEIWEASYDEEIIYYECINGVLYCMEYPEKTFHREDTIEVMDDSEIKGVDTIDRTIDLLSQTDYILSNENVTSRNIMIGSTSDDFIKAYNNCITTVLYFDENSEIAEEVDCEKIDYSRDCAVFLATFFVDDKAINVEEFKAENNIDSDLHDWLKTNKRYLRKHQVVYKCLRFAFQEGAVCGIWLFEVPYNE